MDLSTDLISGQPSTSEGLQPTFKTASKWPAAEHSAEPSSKRFDRASGPEDASTSKQGNILLSNRFQCLADAIDLHEDQVEDSIDDAYTYKKIHTQNSTSNENNNTAIDDSQVNDNDPSK